MNLSNFNTALSLVFAPSFIILMQFFSFTDLTMGYAVAMFAYLLLSIYLKSDLKTISTPLIYFAFIVLAYYFISMELVKVIPALISSFFFFFFLESHISGRNSILKLTKKFSSRTFSVADEKFMAASDGYWSLVTFLNVLIQVLLVFDDNNARWAFYSSVGWYIFFIAALVLQIIYGKFFNVSKENV